MMKEAGQKRKDTGEWRNKDDEGDGTEKRGDW